MALTSKPLNYLCTKTIHILALSSFHYISQSVQSLSHVRLFATPWIAACQASLSITSFRSSLRLTPIEAVMPSSHFILCRPLLLLPPIPPSIRDFSNESTLCMRWPKYWSFSFSIIPSKAIPGLISFRMDWLDLPEVQGTLKSLLQHHSSKASILRCSAFFTVQLSHPYMTTGKTIALTRRTFVGKVMSLPLNMLSRLVVTLAYFCPWAALLLMLPPTVLIPWPFVIQVSGQISLFTEVFSGHPSKPHPVILFNCLLYFLCSIYLLSEIILFIWLLVLIPPQHEWSTWEPSPCLCCLLQ